jgi:hypothetical protein
MEKKQTAVDLFWKQLPEILPSSVDTETGVKLYRAFKQAKQMEKEQIVNAVDGFPLYTRDLLGNDYYNELYGGQDEN